MRPALLEELQVGFVLLNMCGGLHRGFDVGPGPSRRIRAMSLSVSWMKARV
jgi:hypothetical protein